MLSQAAKASRAPAGMWLDFGKYVSDSDENVNHKNHFISKRTNFEKPCFGRKPQFSIS